MPNPGEYAKALYDDVQLLPGTSTKAVIQKCANVSLKGPLNVDLYGFLVKVILHLTYFDNYQRY